MSYYSRAHGGPRLFCMGADIVLGTAPVLITLVNTVTHECTNNLNIEITKCAIRPWSSFWLVVTGEWDRMSVSWFFQCGRKWAQQESDANVLSRTLNERSALVQIMAWDHLEKILSQTVWVYIVTWPRYLNEFSRFDMVQIPQCFYHSLHIWQILLQYQDA